MANPYNPPTNEGVNQPQIVTSTRNALPEKRSANDCIFAYKKGYDPEKYRSKEPCCHDFRRADQVGKSAQPTSARSAIANASQNPNYYSCTQDNLLKKNSLKPSAIRQLEPMEKSLTEKPLNQTAATTKASINPPTDYSEFLIDDTQNNKESVVEKNIYQVLNDHRDCMTGKCLEAKLPILKKSVYMKDYVPQPFSEVIRGAANNPWEAFKPEGRIPIDSTYRVGLANTG